MNIDAEAEALIKRLLENNLINVKDNLIRAGLAFKGFDMDGIYGQSKQTRQEIINDYESCLVLAHRAVEWFAVLTSGGTIRFESNIIPPKNRPKP